MNYLCVNIDIIIIQYHIYMSNFNKIYIPEYKNTQDASIDDTRLFLMEIVGSFIEIKITNNIVSHKFFNNLKMIEDNDLYDNIRCYTEHSVPTFERDSAILKLFEHICATRVCKDVVLFFAIGDFPVVMKNRKQHPRYDKFLQEYDNIYPAYLANIYSRSIIPTLHDDLLFPTRDYINAVLNINHVKKNINHDFYNKKGCAVFMGTDTGNDRTINNTRIIAKIMSIEYPSYLNVNISHPFDYYMYDQECGPLCTIINNDKLINNAHCLTQYKQYEQYKYILHIDGFVAAWRMAIELFSMCVILKVDSLWVEHYYDDLIPYVHYIPIKNDLSDLIQTIAWCNDNPDLCYKIALNAYNYAIANITMNNVCNYLVKLCNLCDNEIANDDDIINNTPINVILPDKIQKEFEYDCNNVSYKYYNLPINNVPVKNKLTMRTLNKKNDYVYCGLRSKLIVESTYNEIIKRSDKFFDDVKLKNKKMVVNIDMLDDANTQNIKSLMTVLNDTDHYVNNLKLNSFVIKNVNSSEYELIQSMDYDYIYIVPPLGDSLIVNDIGVHNHVFILGNNVKFIDNNPEKPKFVIFIKAIYSPLYHLKQIETNCVQYDVDEWNNEKYLHFMHKLVLYPANICINVTTYFQTKFLIFKDEFGKFVVDLTNDVLPLMINYDIITNVQINNVDVMTNEKYITIHNRQSIVIKYISDVKHTTFKLQYKLYLLQHEPRRLISESIWT